MSVCRVPLPRVRGVKGTGFKVWSFHLAAQLCPPTSVGGAETSPQNLPRRWGDHSRSQRGHWRVLSPGIVPPKVKTHLQAQTLSAMAVGHQHNHEVSGDKGGVRGHRGFGGTLSMHTPGPSGDDAILVSRNLKLLFGCLAP